MLTQLLRSATIAPAPLKLPTLSFPFLRFNNRFFTTNTSDSNETTSKKRTKLKIPTKRAASLLLELNNEHVAKSLVEKDIDNFKPGDAVQVEYSLSKTLKKIQRVRGVVIARRNRGAASSFIIRNHIGGVGFEQNIFLHSPLLQSIKVLQEAFIHKGRKRVRRSKLYYLRKKAPRFSTVTNKL